MGSAGLELGWIAWARLDSGSAGFGLGWIGWLDWVWLDLAWQDWGVGGLERGWIGPQWSQQGHHRIGRVKRCPGMCRFMFVALFVAAR